MNERLVGAIVVPLISILFCVAILALAFVIAEWVCEEIGDCIFRF